MSVEGTGALVMGLFSTRGRDEHAQALGVAEEARANTAALTAVVRALNGQTVSVDAARAALETVRECFGWAYGSYWRVDPAEGVAVRGGVR